MIKQIRKRKCLVTKEVYPSYELIRFVCGPQGKIIPDVAAKLPGRGCWVYAKREILEQAVKNKIFLRFGYQVLSAAKSKKADIEDLEEDETAQKSIGNVTVDNDLPDLIEILLLKRCLDYLGLANRAGKLLSGFEKVRASLKSGKSTVLITAIDGATNGRNKMCQGLDNLRVVDIFSRADLSKATGLENAVHLALLPGGISKNLLREISRYGQCKKMVI